MVLYIRSIPAWAGETLRLLHGASSEEVYPRVGGGNATSEDSYDRNIGLSPRGRGKQGSDVLRAVPLRSIPAWAGETRALPAFAPSARVYPRVGGGNRRSQRQ